MNAKGRNSGKRWKLKCGCAIAPGQISGQFGRKQVGVGAGHINVAIQIHTERIHRILPVPDLLHLVQKQVEPLALGGAFHHILIKALAVHVRKLHGLKVRREDLFLHAPLFPQMCHHQFQQAGLAAAPDSGHDLDDLHILNGNELIKILRSVF